jgi:nitroreductase
MFTVLAAAIDRAGVAEGVVNWGRSSVPAFRSHRPHLARRRLVITSSARWHRTTKRSARGNVVLIYGRNRPDDRRRNYHVEMEFSEVIRRRRMVRDFVDRPLEPAVIERILASALRAPSAGFSQGWSFLALTERGDRERFWPFVPTRVENSPAIQLAPLVVIPFANKSVYLERYAQPDKGWQDREEARWPAPYWFIDTGMAALLILLSAVDEGLDACFFGIEPQYLEPFGHEFAVPDEFSAIGAIAVGYRSPELRVQVESLTKRRRGIDQVIHRGEWGRH